MPNQQTHFADAHAEPDFNLILFNGREGKEKAGRLV
jgi:hypothetical protein